MIPQEVVEFMDRLEEYLNTVNWKAYETWNWGEHVPEWEDEPKAYKVIRESDVCIKLGHMEDFLEIIEAETARDELNEWAGTYEEPDVTEDLKLLDKGHVLSYCAFGKEFPIPLVKAITRMAIAGQDIRIVVYEHSDELHGVYTLE